MGQLLDISIGAWSAAHPKVSAEAYRTGREEFSGDPASRLLRLADEWDALAKPHLAVKARAAAARLASARPGVRPGSPGVRKFEVAR